MSQVSLLGNSGKAWEGYGLARVGEWSFPAAKFLYLGNDDSFRNRKQRVQPEYLKDANAVFGGHVSLLGKSTAVDCFEQIESGPYILGNVKHPL